MTTYGNEIDEMFKRDSDISPSWKTYLYHLGYYIPHVVKRFFSSPIKEKQTELNVLNIVSDILSNKHDDSSISQSQELVKLHRVIENTKARKRLETWSLRVIVVYLIIVLILVVSNYLYTGWFDAVMDIPENVMIAILTTTTVNIIGLGLIVLRGHFLANEAIKDEEKK